MTDRRPPQKSWSVTLAFVTFEALTASVAEVKATASVTVSLFAVREVSAGC